MSTDTKTLSERLRHAATNEWRRHIYRIDTMLEAADALDAKDALLAEARDRIEASLAKANATIERLTAEGLYISEQFSGAAGDIVKLRARIEELEAQVSVQAVPVAPDAAVALLTKCEPPPTSAEEELAAFDPLVDEWTVEINWRVQLDQLAGMSTRFAGKRVSGPGGPECKMLILRQRNLFDRLCRQAYLEGIFRGQGLKFTAEGRDALARMTEGRAALTNIEKERDDGHS